MKGAINQKDLIVMSSHASDNIDLKNTSNKIYKISNKHNK